MLAYTTSFFACSPTLSGHQRLGSSSAVHFGFQWHMRSIHQTCHPERICLRSTPRRASSDQRRRPRPSAGVSATRRASSRTHSLPHSRRSFLLLRSSTEVEKCSRLPFWRLRSWSQRQYIYRTLGRFEAFIHNAHSRYTPYTAISRLMLVCMYIFTLFVSRSDSNAAALHGVHGAWDTFEATRCAW